MQASHYRINKLFYFLASKCPSGIASKYGSSSIWKYDI